MTTPPFPFDPTKRLDPNQPIQPIRPVTPHPLQRPVVKPEVVKQEPEPLKPDQFNKEGEDLQQRAQKLTRPKEFGHKMMHHSPMDGVKPGEGQKPLQEGVKEKTTSGESDFEKTMDKVFTDKKANVPSLPEGKTASFAAKPANKWVTFFKNVLSLGSVEKQATQNTTRITQGLYRGTYQQELKSKLGSTLVSDLHFTSEGEKVLVEKFARVLVDNPQLLRTFQQMQPGDIVPKEVFSELGQEINYTQLVHEPEGEILQTTEQQLKLLKSPVGFESQQRLERQFKEERLKHQEARALPFSEKDKKKKEEGEGRPFYFWGDPRWEKQPRLGKPKFWIFFTFGIVAILLTLLFLTLFRGN